VSRQEQEFVADYDVRSPASRTLLTVLGTILTVAIIAGLVLGASILKRDTTVSTSDIELAGSSRILIDAGASDLRIVQGAPGVVRVTARITSGLRKTDFQIGRRGDEIKILADCQSWLNPGCGVDTTLELPEGFPVQIRTTTGDVVVRDVTEGVLTVVTASGDVTGSGLDVDELSAETRSGDISASFATQPFGFKAISRSGDISARMAAGKRKYAVTATTKSGDVSSDVTSEDGGSGFILATTRSGDISIKRP
jgi:hypothetical protein